MEAAAQQPTNQNHKSEPTLVFFILKPALDGSPEETRRFEVATDHITYDELHRRVKDTFGLRVRFNLTFDKHNTTITMTDTNDLKYLVQQQQQQTGFVINKDQADPVVWMKIVILSAENDDDDDSRTQEKEEEWYLKAARWIVSAGRVIMIVAVPILHVFGPALAERLPPPYAQIVLAATAAARKMPELLGHPFSQALLAAGAAFATTTSTLSRTKPNRLSHHQEQKTSSAAGEQQQ
ncbi:hypothetical protein BDB00DRAFT_836195 [Zychaea mexicana]|uniref:uncharacterized protein n=1 Tax=Zychaea mexicana TaxID=64656 RepID=UPI0022FE842F|nr:uncharacterized protein BDB00DRAFT_836195 [Zychaea mexicana]KAI9490803.1 hypothetical protein BDB00DRAFT_836195 [Zychaea mexicana]